MSTTSSVDLKYRTFRPSSIVLMPIRSPFPVIGLNNATFDTWTDASLSMMPPDVPFCGFGLVCRFTTLMPSTTTLPRSASTSRTLPRWPRFRPARTTTSSPFLILLVAIALQDLRCQRHDLHEMIPAQFPRNGTKNSRSNRLELICQQNHCISIEPNQGTIGTTHSLSCAHNYRIVHLAFSDLSSRNGLLDGNLYNIANPGIATFRSTKHLDAHKPTGSTVVGRIKH